MSKPTTEKLRTKKYRCSLCGFEKDIQTNHYGECYSLGDYNVCPQCPPSTRPTVWECAEPLPAHLDRPERWKLVKLSDVAEIK